MSPTPKIKSRSVPECVRCRNHGIRVDKKGHKQFCKFKECKCDKCILLIERKVVESKIKFEEQKEKHQTPKASTAAERDVGSKANNKQFQVNRKINFDYKPLAHKTESIGSYPIQYNTEFMDFSKFGVLSYEPLQRAQEKNENFVNNEGKGYTDHGIDRILSGNQKRLGTDQQFDAYTYFSEIGVRIEPIKTNTEHSLTLHHSTWTNYIHSKTKNSLYLMRNCQSIDTTVH